MVEQGLIFLLGPELTSLLLLIVIISFIVNIWITAFIRVDKYIKKERYEKCEQSNDEKHNSFEKAVREKHIENRKEADKG